MNYFDITIVNAENRENMFPLLKLADDSEDKIREYIHEGELYEVSQNNQTVGAILLTFPAKHEVEIKNMALIHTKRGQGIGKKLIQDVCTIYRRKGYLSMIVGTANSSIGNLAFYQKAGFRFNAIKKDFFNSYKEPIMEYGIQAVDMIILKKSLYK
ncbi:GNAT family N-acetyltransferase [Pontibacillus salipaludis]|uniref:GNAT family N-acetyltransferase n=1 Tax=Pontibacillus salipaludis TaxID=1697394 RepID=UPI0031EA427C